MHELNVTAPFVNFVENQNKCHLTQHPRVLSNQATIGWRLEDTSFDYVRLVVHDITL